MRTLLALSLLLGLAASAEAQTIVAPREAAAPAARLLAARAVENRAAPLGEGALTVERRGRGSLAGGIGGFVVGAVAGGLVGCALNNDDYGAFCGGQNDTKVVVSALLGGALGAWLGARLFSTDD